MVGLIARGLKVSFFKATRKNINERFTPRQSRFEIYMATLSETVVLINEKGGSFDHFLSFCVFGDI